MQPNTEQDALPQRVLACYGIHAAQIHLLGSLWNQVYRVETSEGAQYSLRLCPTEFQSRRALEEEIAFLEFVSAEGTLTLPRPVRSMAGEVCVALPTEEGERLACLFEWVEGEASNAHLSPKILRQIGQIVARLHLLSRNFLSPAENETFRQGYRYDQTVAHQHREWIAARHDELGKANTTLLEQAVAYVCRSMDGIARTRQSYGVIHADLHFGNFLVHKDRVSVIDFDQLGCGYYHYDIAALWRELTNAPETQVEYWEAFKVGYGEVTPLPFESDAELTPFLVAVQVNFLDWVYNASNPEVRETQAHRIPELFNAIRAAIQPNP